MREVIEIIPDVEVFLALEPEELGETVLHVLKRRYPPNAGNQSVFNGTTLMNEFYTYPAPNQPPVYAANRQDLVEQAFTEAWSWLELNGLIVAKLEIMGHAGNRIISRRGYKLNSNADFVAFRSANKLSKEGLHPAIAETVWQQFIRGRYDTAIFEAMKAVEISVRAASGAGNEAVGQSLMSYAFKPDGGRLTDTHAEESEKKSALNLFSGAIGLYKNPVSHRDISLDNPAEAAEIILFANHLLRLVDARRIRREAGTL